MTDIASVSHSSVDQSAPVSSSAERASLRNGESATAPVRESDRVEVSAVARYLSQLRDIPTFRQHLVDSAREEIAGGQYESDERIEGAIDGLFEEEPGLFEDLTEFFEDVSELQG